MFPGKVLRPVCVSVAVAAFTFITVFIASYLLFPVNGVSVRGERMLPEKEAKQAIPEHTSLLTFDSWTLERRLETNPWVEGVTVSRDWNSGIVIVEVQERRAVLKADVGGGEVVLAADGARLPGPGGTKLETVRLDEGRLEDIVGAMRTLESGGVGLESVEEVGPGGVEAVAEGKVLRFTGGVVREQARALDGLLRRHRDAGYFDLRSPERVVLGPPETGQSG